MSIPFMKLALILNIHVYMFAHWITKANIFTKGLKNIDSVEYKYFCPRIPVPKRQVLLTSYLRTYTFVYIHLVSPNES